ncbi:hypothetical protein [Botrimarina sp.]|uniref:hypothetical protein n=1 Tax=Botrimarina sp. TaxID=2795802 RepID=UPI0032ECD2F4
MTKQVAEDYFAESVPEYAHALGVACDVPSVREQLLTVAAEIESGEQTDREVRSQLTFWLLDLIDAIEEHVIDDHVRDFGVALLESINASGAPDAIEALARRTA